MRLFEISSLLDSDGMAHDLLNKEANVEDSRDDLYNSVDSL
jgi:hypothetical protein